MADKMMRIAGRTDNGTAKALNLDNAGYLRTTSINERQYLGDFVEPYDKGYVGNIALSGLEVFGKTEFVISDIVDIKTGKKGIYVLQNDGTLTKFDLHLNEKVWGYKNTDPNIYHLRVDNNDDVIISSGSTTEWRITEKIDGETGTRIWRDVYNNSNYVYAADVFVDLVGDVYTIGKAMGSPTSPDSYLRKNRGSDGTLLWDYTYADEHVNPHASFYIHGEDIYILSRSSIRKLNQLGSDAENPPALIWMHPFTVYDNVIRPEMVIGKDGHAYFYTADNIGWYLVKYDLSNATESTPPVEVERLTLARQSFYPIIKRPIFDVVGNVYIEDGKFDRDLNPIWNEKSPVSIHDIRDGFLYGKLESVGRYGEPIFEVYKLGLDLQIKGYRGIK